MPSILPSPRRAIAAFAAAFAAGVSMLWAAQAGAACETEVPRDLWSERQPLATESMMLDVVRTGDTLFAVGDRGQVLVSEDAGSTWVQQDTPTRSLLTAAWFANRNLGWVVGHDAVILRTEDGGQTWCRVYWDPDLEKPLLDVWFEDDRSGFAVGAYGFFLRTTDGGLTWEEIFFEAEDALAEESDADGEESWDEDFNLGGDFHLNKIIVAGPDRLFIAAEAGTIYRSTDRGRTWLQLPSPYDGSFFSGVYLGGDSVLIFGLRGNVFRSEDAGMSWRRIDMPVDKSLFGGARLEDGSVIVTGSSGVILVSQEGDSFRLVQRGDRKVLVTLQQAGEGGVVIVGEPGVERVEFSELASR